MFARRSLARNITAMRNLRANSVKVHYVSDLHLETNNMAQYKVAKPEPDVRGLILAGDIGWSSMKNHRNFLVDCGKKYKNVWYIAGNHEFSGNSARRDYDADFMKKYLDMCDNIDEEIATCNYIIGDTGNGGKIKFLNGNGLYIHNGLYLYGATLWSQRHVRIDRDYDINKICAEQLEDLWERVEYIYNQNTYRVEEERTKMLVVSHFLPSYRMIGEKYSHLRLADRFAHNFEKTHPELLSDPIHWWICGHSHDIMHKYIGPNNEVQCLLNAIGPDGLKVEPKHRWLPVKELVMNLD